MLDKLSAAWRLRRVLLIGGPDAHNLYAQALLDAIGARTARLPPDAGADTLYRALSSGRIGALLIPSAHALAEENDLFAQLGTLRRILGETREAGVPLVLLCSHEDVYAPLDGAWQADEHAPLGGHTQSGLYQSILQLYALGVARGLEGDAVTVICCRHAPCLGSGHPRTAQYDAWCRAILRGEAPVVEHPGAQGTFLHPLDVILGALCLGAHFFEGAADCSGAYNLGVPPENRLANRTACLHLIASQGEARVLRETHPPYVAPHTPLQGDTLRRLCGYHPLLDAKETLSWRLEAERAAAVGESTLQLLIEQQAKRCLELLKSVQ